MGNQNHIFVGYHDKGYSDQLYDSEYHTDAVLDSDEGIVHHSIQDCVTHNDDSVPCKLALHIGLLPRLQHLG